MILESSYWKDTLQKHARFLHQKLSQRVWRDSSFARLEEAVMLSSYIVRKLAEAKKISVETYNQAIPLRSFSATGRAVNLLNHHRIDELYHMKGGSHISKPLSYVVNQLIHSYVFVPVFESPEKIYGFTFNSDRSKVKALYMVSLETLAEKFARIANLYVGRATYIRVKSSGEWEVIPEEHL